MKTILITGGSGLVGRRLSDKLIEKGYSVIWLSRERYVKAAIPRYKWDYRKGEIEEEAIKKADIVVHLSGSNLAEGSWTRPKKQRIEESRVKTAQLLFDKFKEINKKPEAFISASAIGYYGTITSDKLFTEEDSPQENDFLSRTCRKWEDAAKHFTDEMGVRSVSLRSGFVVSKKNEGFQKMVNAVRFWAGSPLGKGNQYFSWIHIDDLCDMYIKAIEDISMQGVYNAVAPEHITNAGFMRNIAKVMKKPFFFPKVPEFILRLMMGEAAEIILKGSRVSSEKIKDAGFKFTYPNSEKAIEEELKKEEKPKEKK